MVIAGTLYAVLGLFFGAGFRQIVDLFPRPVLGVILLFEALALIKLVRDMAVSAADFTIVLLVGLIAFGVPYGYVIGLVIGTALAYWLRRKPAGFAA